MAGLHPRTQEDLGGGDSYDIVKAAIAAVKEYSSDADIRGLRVALEAAAEVIELASQSYNSTFAPFFETVAKLVGCWGENTSRIQSKEVHATQLVRPYVMGRP